MKENSSKIDNWLQKNAECIFKYTLRQPGTTEDIEKLESLDCQPLPDGFKEIYLLHDGSD